MKKLIILGLLLLSGCCAIEVQGKIVKYPCKTFSQR